MKKYVRVLAFTLLTGASVTMTACSDKVADPQPAIQVQKATLTGQIQTPNAVTLVTATNATGASVTAVPTSSGTYTFADLAVGSYTLAFTPAEGYVAPTNQSVTLAKGGTSVPALTVTVAPASVSYTVDGVTTVQPAYRNVVVLDGSYMVHFSTQPGGTGHAVTFFFEKTPTTGTFSVLDERVLSAEYMDPSFNTYFTKGYDYKGSSGSVTITSLGTSPRRMTGTFNFVAVGVGNSASAPVTRTIKGTFTNVLF